jgi:hypothetical protein
MAGPVQQFLKRQELPSTNVFTSLFVLLPGDDTNSFLEAFGYPFELDVESVLPSITLVCSDDIQNAASNHGSSPKVCADLRGKSSKAKELILREARLNANNKRAEARTDGLLKAENFLPLPVPDSSEEF